MPVQMKQEDDVNWYQEEENQALSMLTCIGQFGAKVLCHGNRELSNNTGHPYPVYKLLWVLSYNKGPLVFFV